MRMKDYFNRRKSKLLLFTLLTMLVVGASPARAQKTLPYSYGFEEASCSTSGWTKVNCHSSSENNKASAYSGSYAFRFYYTSNYPQYLISPELATSSYSISVSFWYKAHSTSYEESFQVGYSTTDAETSSFTFGDEVKTKSTDWQEYTTTCPAGTKYICIACTSNDKYCLYIDDLVIDSDSPYKTPKAFASTGVTAATATFGWTAGGDETAWQIAYSSTEGFDVDAATKVDVTTNPYTLEGLTAETTYYARIRADYSGGNYSSWSSEVSFKPTNAITTTINDGSSTNSHVPFNGNYADTNGTMSQFIIPASTLTSLQGRMIQDMTFYTSTATKDFGNARFDVYMAETSATAFDAATFDWSDMDKVATSATVNIADGKMTITLDEGFNYSGDNLMIGFNLVATGGYTATSWYGIEVENAAIKYYYSSYGGGATIESFLPKITFTSLPGVAVAVKKPKSLAASEVGAATATLGWTDGEEGLTEWQIAYATDTDFNPDSEGTKVDAEANPYTLTELTASTTYYAYVRAKKGDDYSAWSNKVEFTTLAATPIMELSATALSFGLVSDADAQAQTFTIGNTGGVALSNLSVTCGNAAFTITDGEGNALGTTIAAGATLTVKVKMNAVGQQSGTITISGDGVEAQTVTVSGYMLDNTKIAEVFTSAAPEHWTEYAYKSSYSTYNWTYSVDGAYNSNENSTLTSPKLTVAEGETMIVYGKLGNNATYGYITVEGSADNGETWTAYTKKLDYTAFSSTTNTFQLITLDDVPATLNKLRFKCYYAYLNAINGFTYAPDPVLALYSDEACTTTVASEVSKSFGFVTEDQSQSYYIKNTGTGQIDLSASVVDGFAVNITDEALTAGESTAVTITMPATEGTHNAAIVITAKNHDTDEVLGTFTVNASGALRDARKYYADGFAALPTGWSVDGSWSYNATNGAYTNAWNLSSNARLKTPMLTLATDETIAVEAKGLSTDNTSYQHLQLQYSADGTTWTNLDDELTLDPNNWQTFMVTGPAEAGKYYIGILASQACVRMFYGGEEVAGANFAINTDGSEQDFGKVAANATAEKSFTVSNNGNTPLFVTISNPADFTAEMTPNAADKNVYFTDALGWGDIHVYYWNDGPDWPGVAMTELYTNEYGQKVYYCELPDDVEGIIFNGNGNQTVDIKDEPIGKAYYTTDGKDGNNFTVGTWSYNNCVPAGESSVLTVTMNTATPGTKSGNVTLSFEALNATSFTIPCTGFVKDPNALAVDFEDNAMPENWQVGTDWTVGSASSNYYAVQSATSVANATSLVTAPLTVGEDETLTFKVCRNASGSGYKTLLQIRYSQDGGVNWSNYTTYYNENDYNYGGSFTTKTVSGVPAGTVILEFYGCNIKLDDIEGFTKTTGPVLVLTEGTAAVANGDTKDFGNITADATATYTLKNAGNKTLAASLAGEGVTVSPDTVNLEAGETAEITVTMAYAEPYGEKAGTMTITSKSWVGDMTVNFTADAIDQSGFVVDFSDNARPAGWYNGGWTIDNGVAYIYGGVNKQLISEKIGAEVGKNVLRFEAKAYTGSESQTLSVYTSADRKTWSEAQTFTLTGESQTFSLDTLDDGKYYVKFEALNAQVDNIKGVKKLDAPAHDLYLVSSTLPTAEITPLDTYTAKVSVASLRADETVTAQLYFGENKIAEQTFTVSNGATQEFTLASTTAAGTWDVYVKVFTDDLSLETEKVSVTVADKSAMTINDFAAAATSVQADGNNAYEAAFNVTVENTGSTNLSSDSVAVTLTDTNDTENTIGTSWTATTTAADMLYMRTTNGSGDDIAPGCILRAWCWNTAEDGEWIEFTKVSDTLYSLDLNGKENYIVTRVNPEGTDEYPWNNVWNKTADMTVSAGRFISFRSYGDGSTMNFDPYATGTLKVGESLTLKVALSGTLTDGENKTLTFKAKENVSNTEYVLSRSVSVKAAPVITLDESAAATIATGENRKVSLAHKFVAGWNTVCVPFAIGDLSIFGEEAVAFSFSGYDAGTKELTFNKVETLEAAKPYVVYTPAAINSTLTFTGVTIAENDTIAGKFAYSDVTFQGTYRSVVFSELDGDQYGLTAEGRIQKAGAQATMKGFRAYFNGIAAGASARFVGFDETQGISTVSVENAAAEGTYDMQGRKVEKLRKGGLYIVGGKKTVVR